ncbi:MAG: nucleoside transporter C-terminal domain-containing protein [Flavobacteriales bacterium]
MHRSILRAAALSALLFPLAAAAHNGPAALTGPTATSLLRGILGMATLVGVAWAFSTKRRQVDWKVVGIGLAFQLVLALLILYVPPVQIAFEVVGKLFVKVLDFTRIGSEFLFRDLMNVQSAGFIFALQILPTIIFFSALTSVLFYLGIIQKVVYALAWALNRTMRLSGAESLSTAGNIFLGQTEAPLMVKAYLDKMNRSEIFLVMTAGMATVAGGVLAAYVGFLGGDDPVQRLFFAKHLLTASVMAAPGAVVIAKILFPQTEPIEQKLEVSMEQVGSNFLDAMSNGTTEGLKLAANVGAMLLVFFAFIAMANYAFLKLGDLLGINGWVVAVSNGNFQGLSLEFLLGYLFAPLMWLIGVASEDITLTGRLVGEKIIASEFVGYESLASMKASGMFSHQRSIVMATYMLCGFANFASIGIQIGGIGSLAPSRRAWLSEFGFRALLGGTLASLLSATIIGMLV